MRSAGSWIIVTQVKSNRLVYFTDDPDYQPVMEGDWYFVSQYLGDLPAAMTLRNCWGWRFNGGVFKDVREPEPKPQLERLLDSNRRALLTLLRDKISQARSRFTATCALGNEVRQQKLLEARQYASTLTEALPETLTFPMLDAIATARGISLSEAASLVESRHTETLAMLVRTERVREHYTQAIHRALTQDDMVRLRRELLDEVLPELSAKFPFPASTFEPEDWQKPLSETHQAHEIARLRTQLREVVNAVRSRLQDDSAYIANDVVSQRRVKLARALLDNGGIKPDDLDFTLLEVYARGRDLSLPDAASELLATMRQADEKLVQTEILKETIQARIHSISTLRDIQAIGVDLQAWSASATGTKS
ncbi:hypothetical protein CS8_012890 [Cupriavidus sp. 8B]